MTQPAAHCLRYYIIKLAWAEAYDRPQIHLRERVRHYQKLARG